MTQRLTEAMTIGSRLMNRRRIPRKCEEQPDNGVRRRVASCWDLRRSEPLRSRYSSRNREAPVGNAYSQSQLLAKAGLAQKGNDQMAGGQRSGTGAMVEMEDEKVRKEDILSNRDKAQRRPGEGLDGKGVQVDEYKDNPMNRRPKGNKGPGKKR